MKSLALAIGVLMLTLCLLGMTYGYYMMRLVTDPAGVAAATFKSDPVVAAGNALVGKLLDRARAKAIAEEIDTTTISDKHVVTVARIVDLADLLAPGEAVPPPALHELYAEARATAQFRPLCAEILESLARRCAVITSAAKPVEGGYLLTGVIGFATGEEPDGPEPDGPEPDGPEPNGPEPNGATPPEAAKHPPGRLKTLSFEPPDDLRSAVTVAEAAQRRKDYYTAVARACATLKHEHGSCIIKGIHLIETVQADGTIQIRGEARLSYPERAG